MGYDQFFFLFSPENSNVLVTLMLPGSCYYIGPDRGLVGGAKQRERDICIYSR